MNKKPEFLSAVSSHLPSLITSLSFLSLDAFYLCKNQPHLVSDHQTAVAEIRSTEFNLDAIVPQSNACLLKKRNSTDGAITVPVN